MTLLEDALRAADAVADAFLAGRHVPGVAYGVVVGGELIHTRGIGTLRVGEAAPPDADSVFRIASMTKSFTAATVVALRDEGRLALDDPIAHHVPELAALRGPTDDSPPVTVAQPPRRPRRPGAGARSSSRDGHSRGPDRRSAAVRSGHWSPNRNW
jgi:CubicO group peptidase (beta-lactamase class C family)